MQINCLGCGYKVDLGNCYDDYEGQIKCYACGTIIEVAAHEGSVRTVKFAAEVPDTSGAIVFVRTDG